MRSPEMSHSPAYYQEQGPFGTANPRSIPTPPPAARRSQEQSSILGHPVGSRPSSLSSDASPRASASRGYRVYHQTQGGSSWPTAESRDTDSFPAGSTLSGAHKEERVRSSITDRPSLMSGEHSNPSITRVRKRGIPSDEIVTHEGHDALLMLVCIEHDRPLYYTNMNFIVSPHNCSSILLWRLLLRNLRLLVRPPRLTSPPLFILSIPPLYNLCLSAMRPPLSITPHSRATGLHPSSIGRGPIILNPMDSL